MSLTALINYYRILTDASFCFIHSIGLRTFSKCLSVYSYELSFLVGQYCSIYNVLIEFDTIATVKAATH